MASARRIAVLALAVALLLPAAPAQAAVVEGAALAHVLFAWAQTGHYRWFPASGSALR